MSPVHRAFPRTELAALGIFNGYPDQTFGGKRAVTRYETAVALQRLLQESQRGPLVVRTPSETAPLGDDLIANFQHEPVCLTLPEPHAQPLWAAPFRHYAASATSTLGPRLE